MSYNIKLNPISTIEEEILNSVARNIADMIPISCCRNKMQINNNSWNSLVSLSSLGDFI